MMMMTSVTKVGGGEEAARGKQGGINARRGISDNIRLLSGSGAGSENDCISCNSEFSVVEGADLVRSKIFDGTEIIFVQQPKNISKYIDPKNICELT